MYFHRLGYAKNLTSNRLRVPCGQIVDIGFSAFHHHFNEVFVPEYADIFKWIAVNDQEVGVEPGFDGAEFLFSTNAFCSPTCRGLDGLHLSLIHI